MTDCTESARPIDLIWTNENIETKFQTDCVSNSLIVSDGSKADFYSDNFFEGVFVNFTDNGTSERSVNYHSNDPGLEIIENETSKQWTSKHVG